MNIWFIKNNGGSSTLDDLRVYVAYTSAQQIYSAAYSAKCTDGSGALGNGCAIAVNKVLQTALGFTIPNPNGPAFTCGGRGWYPAASHTCSTTWVPDVVQSLIGQGYGTKVSQQQAMQGDIVVQDGGDAVNGMNHIGICEDTPCTTVLSNMSSTGRLCGETNVTMSNNGYDYDPTQTPTFYHINDYI